MLDKHGEKQGECGEVRMRVRWFHDSHQQQHEGEIEKLRSELRASADAQHSSHTKSNKLLKLLLDITAYALEKAKESDALNNKWKAVTDPSTGKPYYHNEATGETRWDKPDDQMNDLVKYIRRMSNNGDGIALPGTLSCHPFSPPPLLPAPSASPAFPEVAPSREGGAPSNPSRSRASFTARSSLETRRDTRFLNISLLLSCS